MATIANPVPVFWRSKKREPVLQIQRNGKGARSRRKIVNRQQGRQQQYRVAFSRVQLLWKAITSGERATWESFNGSFTSENKYGDTIIIGAFQWFSRYNCRLAACGQSLITTAPPDTTPSYTPSFIVATAPVGFPMVVIPVPPVMGSQSILARRRIQQSPGTSVAPKPLVYFGVIDSSSSIPYDFILASENTSTRFKHWYEFIPYDEYGRSPGSTISFISAVP